MWRHSIQFLNFLFKLFIFNKIILNLSDLSDITQRKCLFDVPVRSSLTQRSGHWLKDFDFGLLRNCELSNSDIFWLCVIIQRLGFRIFINDQIQIANHFFYWILKPRHPQVTAPFWLRMRNFKVRRKKQFKNWDVFNQFQVVPSSFGSIFYPETKVTNNTLFKFNFGKKRFNVLPFRF